MMVLVDPKLKPRAADGFLVELSVFNKEKVYIGDNHKPVVNSQTIRR